MQNQAKNHIEYLEVQRDLFEADYIYMHPKPETDTRSQRYTLLFMLGATIIVSARHNIPFFLGEVMPEDDFGKFLTVIFAISIVIMVEVGLVKFGEFIIEYMDDHTVTMIRPWLLGFALFLLLVLAIFSNVIHQLDIKQIHVTDWLKTLINILAGLSAPVMALIIGIIFASLQLKVDQAKNDWQTAFNRAYGKFKSSNEIDITVSKPSIPQTDTPRQLSASMSNQTDNRQTGAGFRRSSTAIDNARQWLLDNPERVDESARKLAQDVPNAGKDSINTARNQLKEEGLI